MNKLNLGIIIWCGLGFYRGYQSCENKDNKLKAIKYGFCGLFIYMNPLTLPLIIESEYKKIKNQKTN